MINASSIAKPIPASHNVTVSAPSCRYGDDSNSNDRAKGCEHPTMNESTAEHCRRVDRVVVAKPCESCDSIVTVQAQAITPAPLLTPAHDSSEDDFSSRTLYSPEKLFSSSHFPSSATKRIAHAPPSAPPATSSDDMMGTAASTAAAKDSCERAAALTINQNPAIQNGRNETSDSGSVCCSVS